MCAFITDYLHIWLFIHHIQVCVFFWAVIQFCVFLFFFFSLKSTEDEGWWEGELSGRRGFFPDNFVMVIPADDLHVSVGQRNVLMIGPFVHC